MYNRKDKSMTSYRNSYERILRGLRFQGGSFRKSDILGMRSGGLISRGKSDPAVLSVVASLPASEVLSFFHTLHSFSWSELSQGDGINVHGIGIFLGSQR